MQRTVKVTKDHDYFPVYYSYLICCNSPKRSGQIDRGKKIYSKPRTALTRFIMMHDGAQDELIQLNGINEGIHDTSIVNSFPEGSDRKYSTIKHILSCQDL